MECDKEIVAEIRQDIERGVDRLLSVYRQRLRVEAVSLCHDASAAEDLVLQAVESAIQHIDAFRGEGSLFEWLRVIMLNLYRNSLRRKSVRSVVFTDAVPENAEELVQDGADQLERDIDGRIIREIVESLPKEMKEAVILHYFLDMPVSRIAHFLFLPAGTVKSRLYYARKALAERLQVKKFRSLAVVIGLAVATVAVAAGKWFAEVFRAESPVGIVCGVQGQHSDEPVLVLGLKVVPPDDAVSAFQATWRFRISTNSTVRTGAMTNPATSNKSKGEDMSKLGRRLATVSVAAALPLTMVAENSELHGASRCDSVPIAFNSCPGGSCEEGKDVFLSRYRQGAASNVLPRFNSREPKGLFILIH